MRISSSLLARQPTELLRFSHGGNRRGSRPDPLRRIARNPQFIAMAATANKDYTHWFARVAIVPKPNSRRSAVTSVRPSTSAVAAKKRSAGSGCSSGNSWAIVPGLGKRERIDCLGVKWPLLGGETQRFNDLPIDRCIAIVEGEEKWN